MSIKLMAQVWDMDNPELNGSKLLTLLALADYANEQDTCWPSIPTLAKRARVSERQAQRIIQWLEEQHYIECTERGNGKGHSSRYLITLNGDIAMSPNAAAKDDIAMSPNEPQRVTSSAPKGDIQRAKGDIAMSPDPSSDPPIEPSSSSASVASPKHDGDDDGSVAEWKQLTSAMHRYGVTLSGYMIEQYQDMLSEYGLSAVLAGLESAAGNSKAGVLKYVRSCVVSAANGSGAGQLVNGSAPPAVKLVPVEDTV